VEKSDIVTTGGIFCFINIIVRCSTDDVKYCDSCFFPEDFGLQHTHDTCVIAGLSLALRQLSRTRKNNNINLCSKCVSLHLYSSAQNRSRGHIT